MRIVYYALKPTQVGDEVREPGDLIPEALSWPFISGYVQDGHLAPVLVATLPEEQQVMLLEWEEEQNAPQASEVVPEAPVEEPEIVDPEDPEFEDEPVEAVPVTNKKGKVA